MLVYQEVIEKRKLGRVATPWLVPEVGDLVSKNEDLA